ALQLEKEISPELVQRLMRLAHTLKGAASVVKQRGIAAETHALEDALAPLRDGAGPSKGAIDAIIAHTDAIAAQVAALAPAAGTAAPKAAGAAIDEPFSMLRADIAEMDSLLDGISEAS